MLRAMSMVRILITAGPTREPIDPVRFISNRSSGKMGYALVEAAVVAGHRVTLLSGPVNLPPPAGARLRRFETSNELRVLTLKEAGRADVIFMVAAIADYQPVTTSREKLKKNSARMVLRLRRTPDILTELGRRKLKSQILIGFAAETNHLLENAQKKLKSKNLDFIIANRVGGKKSGFESDYNQVTILKRGGNRWSLPRMTKHRLARKLIRSLVPGKKMNSNGRDKSRPCI